MLSTLLLLGGLLSQAPVQGPTSPAEASLELALETAAPRSAHREISESAQRVAQIRRRLTRALFERSPWLAHERGFGELGFGMGRYGPDGVGWWVGVLNDASSELGTIPLEDLNAEQELEFEAVRTWTESEAIRTFSTSQERWNAVSYVERVERLLQSLLDSKSDDEMARALEVAAVLAELPAYWSIAERGLVAPSREWSDEAAQRLVDLGATIQAVIPKAFPIRDWPEKARKEFQRTRTQALQATVNFREWLLDEAIKTGGPARPISPENWSNLMSSLTGTEMSVGQLKTRLLRDVSALDREMGRRPRLRPAANSELRPGLMGPRMVVTANEALDLAIAAELVEPLEDWQIQLEPRLARPRSEPGHPVRVRSSLAGTHVLEVELGGKLWPETAVRTRSSLFTLHAQRAQALRYGFPGQALLRIYAAGLVDREQRFLWNRVTLEGWGLYALDWIQRVDWVPEAIFHDEDLRFEIQRMKLFEAARLLATIELHAEERSIEEVADSLRRRTGFDAATSLAEARLAMHDPLYGLGYLGYLELVALETELGKDYDPRDAIRHTLAYVRAHPTARPADIRRLLLHGSR